MILKRGDCVGPSIMLPAVFFVVIVARNMPGKATNILAESSLLEKEKKRLLEMSRNKSLPPHKEYRAELNKLTEYVQLKTKKKEKIIHKPKKSLVDYF
jgi:hypothetical protein